MGDAPTSTTEPPRPQRRIPGGRPTTREAQFLAALPVDGSPSTATTRAAGDPPVEMAVVRGWAIQEFLEDGPGRVRHRITPEGLWAIGREAEAAALRTAQLATPKAEPLPPAPLDGRLRQSVAVLTAIAVGARRLQDIVNRTGISAAGVQAALASTTAAGLISRDVLGRYQLTDAGRDRVMMLALRAAASTLGDDELDLDQADLPTIWQHLIAPYTLPGSRLETHQQIRPGVDEYLLRLTPGRHTIDDARAQRARIAAGLQRPIEQLIIEAGPGGIGNLIRLTRVDDTSPLYHPVDHPGASAFDQASGTLHIGLYADHTPATWRLWNERGTIHHLVCGDSSAGTVELLRGALTAVAGDELVRAYCVDPTGLDDLAAAGHPTAVTPATAVDLLAEVAGIINQRGQEAAGQQMLIPTPDHPLILLVLAGLPAVLASDRRARYLIDQIHRTACRAGVAIIADTTSLLVSEFGGNVKLRDGLAMDELTVLRSSCKMSALQLAPGRPGLKPAALPIRWFNGVSTRGVGFTPHRDAAFRAFQVRADG
ncbi:hypothetical protein [Micromonospora sp. NPDC049662]|uniref:hypothetical protein n=1 Tax=Micromonospora sp. NPDC049662 TaxID=3155397 RepID=UPI003424C8AD